MAYIKLIRPVQWLKNLMLFFPPFLAGSFFHLPSAKLFFLPFMTFCVASSAAYIFNDYRDVARDRAHPVKKGRPLACGAISPTSALVTAVMLIALSLSIALTISVTFSYMLVLYMLISLSYSIFLKGYPVVDIFCISSGFLLRLLAGGEAFHVTVSSWLFICVFLLSIFLSTGKRLAEKELLNSNAEMHREVLSAYPDGVLDGFLYMSGSSVLVAYSIYVVSRDSLLLLCTVPLCAFGLFRYILRVKCGKGGDPTESLTRDTPLLLVGLSWAVLVAAGVYLK